MSAQRDKRKVANRQNRPHEHLEERIAETERSLSFARQFLKDLEAVDEAGYLRVKEIAHSLERELDRLRSIVPDPGRR